MKERKETEQSKLRGSVASEVLPHEHGHNLILLDQARPHISPPLMVEMDHMTQNKV